MKFDSKLRVGFAIQPIEFPAEVLWCSLECTPPCQGGGREFKSSQDRFTQSKRIMAKAEMRIGGRVAQLAERPPEKR